jgi:hypothetical protein
MLCYLCGWRAYIFVAELYKGLDPFWPVLTDIAMTLTANALYNMSSSQIRLFKKDKAKILFTNFIEGEAQIRLTPQVVQVRFGKKATNQLIMDWVRTLPPTPISRMEHRTMDFPFAKNLIIFMTRDSPC